MALYIFLFLSAVAVFCGLMTILSRNPIHSALYLIICFFSISCHYLLLNAQLLFFVNIIVYSGAIMVLFLFTLMFMNLNEETEKHKALLWRFAAGAAGFLLFAVMLGSLYKADNMAVPYEQNKAIGTIENLGKVLLNEYFFPFEFVSVLFLSAMIGAVLLTKKEKQAIS